MGWTRGGVWGLSSAKAIPATCDPQWGFKASIYSSPICKSRGCSQAQGGVPHCVPEWGESYSKPGASEKTPPGGISRWTSVFN